MSNNKRLRQAKRIRIFRKIHRTAGIFLFIFFFVIGITSILLGIKKHSAELIMPKTKKGISENLNTWLPIDSLKTIAIQTFKDSISSKTSTEIDKLDIRPNKGIVKVIFIKKYWEVQLDGTTGKVLSVGKRYSDMIENIHDGSILDDYFETDNEQIKLTYTITLGTALILFTVTGFWLWYGPKQMKKSQRK